MRKKKKVTGGEFTYWVIITIILIVGSVFFYNINLMTVALGVAIIFVKSILQILIFARKYFWQFLLVVGMIWVVGTFLSLKFREKKV